MELEKGKNNAIKIDNHFVEKYIDITKIVIILSLIAILFVSVSSVSAVDVTISTTNATGINGAINTVSSGGTVNNSITLNAGVYNKTTDLSNDIMFSGKNLSVRGNGAPSAVIIDGNNAKYLFFIVYLAVQ
ncbi:hypothetical protein [Methanobrevibacter filiformis]|nr:hypothetical protein [Methanobrevibacter filiformis]